METTITITKHECDFSIEADVNFEYEPPRNEFGFGDGDPGYSNAEIESIKITIDNKTMDISPLLDDNKIRNAFMSLLSKEIQNEFENL